MRRLGGDSRLLSLRPRRSVQQQVLLKDEAGNRHIGPAIKFTQDPAQPELSPPAYGEDNEDDDDSLICAYVLLRGWFAG